MVLFGWKKTKPLEEKETKAGGEIKTLVPSQPAIQPASAPLFVKLEKYKTIESNLNELKLNLDTLKNSFSIFKEVESVKGKNIEIIQEALVKMEKNVSALLTEFARPLEINEEIRETPELTNLSKTLANLKNQIDQLKAQLEKL
jgi:predicted RNase H-like nuclease (RuvC/YqgF family)